MSPARREVHYEVEDRCYVFICPHCDCLVQVSEDQVNCHIFRHGILKSTGQQINPHAPQDHCERLMKQDLVHGCCKPFRLSRDETGVITYAEKCDYI